MDCAHSRLQTGIAAVTLQGSQQSLTLSSTRAQKRKLSDTDLEIPNSEDEDYGWEGDAMPDLPSQWQGSEDVLLGRQGHSDQEESGDDAEGEHEPVAHDSESD